MIHLGDTLPLIAAEKAGIIKPNVPVITAAEPEALEVIRATARDRNAPLTHIRTPGPEVLELKLRLPGEFQALNAATAWAVAEEIRTRGFDIPDSAIRRGLESAYIPGRLEVLREHPTLLIDGAHNADAARRLAGALRSDFEFDRLILVMGMVSGHVIQDVLEVLAPLAGRFIATSPSNERAAPASELASVARPHCPDVAEIVPVSEAVRAALADARENDLVLVTGSFYTIGEVPRKAVGG